MTSRFRAWLLILLVSVLCGVSVLWSAYPLPTARRSVTFSVCVFFGIWCYLVFGFSQFLRWVAHITVVLGICSIVVYFVLPSVALGYYVAPPFMRLVRAGMIEVLASDYVRTARAMGLSKSSVVLKHALRNALVPVVALAAVQLGFLLGGSVVIETIFALDGLGYLAYQSISHLDLPVTQAIVTLLSFIYVGLTLTADLVNAWIDPRLRVG